MKAIKRVGRETRQPGDLSVPESANPRRTGVKSLDEVNEVMTGHDRHQKIIQEAYSGQIKTNP